MNKKNTDIENKNLLYSKKLKENQEIVQAFIKETSKDESDIFGIIPEENGIYTIMTNDYESYVYYEDVKKIVKVIKDDSKLTEEQLSKVEYLTEEEKEEYYLKNKNLIYFTLKRIDKPKTVEMEELEGYATLGFIKALNTYNKANGTKFSTYVVKCMINELYYYLRKIYKYMFDAHLEDIIAGEGDNMLTVEDLCSANEHNMLRERQLLPEEEVELNELQTILNETLQTLDDSERYLILHRYGINGEEIYTQVDIAKTLSMSQANISKLERNILRKMRLHLMKIGYVYDGKSKQLEEPIGEPIEDYSTYREVMKKPINIKDKLEITVRVSEILRTNVEDIKEVIQTTSKEWFKITFNHYNMFYAMYNNITDKVQLIPKELTNQERFICHCLNYHHKFSYDISAFNKPFLLPELSPDEFNKLLTILPSENVQIIKDRYNLEGKGGQTVKHICDYYNITFSELDEIIKNSLRTIREYLEQTTEAQKAA